MHPDDANVFSPNIIDKYEHRLNKLHSIYLADFTSSYVSEKADDLPTESDEIKSCSSV